MRIGFLVPTEVESRNIHELNRHVTCAGYGTGKVAACAAAADLIFNKYCDTIIVWGLAGGLSRKVDVNDIVVASRVAYRDFNVYPLFGSTGVGWVEGFAENIFVDLDAELRAMLLRHLGKTFPGRRILEGTVCSGDQFLALQPGDPKNRVEQVSDVVDMESAAVVHFCSKLNRNIKVGVVRVISDNADHNAGVDFNTFVDSFADMNDLMYQFRRDMLDEEDTGDERILSAIRSYSDFPVKGTLFKDIWGIFSNLELFESVCHRLYDLFHIRHRGAGITKVVGIESRGFILGFEMARIFGVPFVPLRKEGKLPGDVVADTYKTEYSESCLEAQRSSFTPEDRVLLVDDIIATGGSLCAAQNIVRKCGAECRHCLAMGQIGGLNGAEFLASQGLSADCLFEL